MFCLSPDPRAFLSFPTRRSSDLSRAFAPCGPAMLGVYGLFQCPLKSGLPFGRRGVGPAGGRLAPRDRKSTRLNSSHEWISYAGFCLKKKTIMSETEPHHYAMQKI